MNNRLNRKTFYIKITSTLRFILIIFLVFNSLVGWTSEKKQTKNQKSATTQNKHKKQNKQITLNKAKKAIQGTNNSLSSSLSNNIGKNLGKKMNPNKPSALEKKMVFNDQMINGKYQIPGEGLVTVENEKSLLNLVSIRTDFKDRRAKELQRD